MRTATHETKLPHVLGIPVSYDPALPVLSDCSGLWPWKKITVGPAFLELSDRQKGAVLLHEAGHCKLLHVERLILHVLARPRLVWALIAASIVSARRFKRHSAEALICQQVEIERRAPGIALYRQNQERQADAYARGCGYGEELAQVILACGPSGGLFHPPMSERIDGLTKYAIFDTANRKG